VKLTEEQIEVLKNPHSNLELLSEEFFKSCGFRCGIDVCTTYIKIASNTHCNVYINLIVAMVEWDGRYSLLIRETEEFVDFLEDLFKYPLLPTKEERGLFFIEFGFEYPIEEHQIA